MEVSRIRVAPAVRAEPVRRQSHPPPPRPIPRELPPPPVTPPVGSGPGTGLVLREPDTGAIPPWRRPISRPTSDPPPPPPDGDDETLIGDEAITDEDGSTTNADETTNTEAPTAVATDDEMPTVETDDNDAPIATAVPAHLRLSYNTTRYQVGTPPAFAQLEFYERALEEAHTGGFQVTGAETETEILCTTRALWFVSTGETSAARGGETDIKIDIDGTIRRVTVRVPPEGPAQAVLHPPHAWAPAVELTTLEDWTVAIESAFGVRVPPPSDQTKPWTADELARVFAGLGRLDDAERSALRGVALIRVEALEGDAAGMFRWLSDVSEEGDPIRVDQLELADGAFDGDAVAFVGSGDDPMPASIRTVVHEAGHAVESAEKRDALFARNDAVVDYNRASDVYVDDLNRELSRLYRSGPADEIQTLQAFLDATIAVHRAFNDLVGETDANLLPGCVAAIEAATATRNAASVALADVDLAGAEAIAAIQNTHAGRVVRLAETRLELERVAGAEQSARLEEFVQLVNGLQAAPPTRYALENWPDKPGEFYAEAFALYRTDPEFLAAHRPDIFAWFEGDNHVD